MDIKKDSVSGISWYNAKTKLLNNKTGSNIIVAVIDTEMDINHINFKKNIWLNAGEVPNNGIDDDNNNYIDDNNGWNFIGNLKNENITEANKEYVRIYRYYKEKYNRIDTSNLVNNEIKEYKKFYKIYFDTKKRLETSYKRVHSYYEKYIKARTALKKYFPNYNYSNEILNKIDTVGNGLKQHVDLIKDFLDYNDTDKNFNRVYNIYKNKFEKRGNIDFNERDILNEDENDINDIGYGNNNVSGNLNLYKHATEVAGVIKEDFIKIMPLAIAPYGDTHDKDIALAIRYAVDNGAKIINMSFGKDYSLHKEWVFDALKYAEQHNVLIVSSAGNSRINLDEITTYPNDHNGNGVEVSDNFLMVGGSTREPNENLYYINSNYGKTTVDVFAPAVEIYTTLPNNEYITDTGTSLAAALTSKVAALIFLHYPNLTASQVKHIIMDSGVEYTFPVKTPTREDKDKMTPFNELSKSGKIVNAYNALIMADSISRKQ
ncbi:S8 family serine peptidase [Pontimicrobium sp. MEBiC06410]